MDILKNIDELLISWGTAPYLPEHFVESGGASDKENKSYMG